MRPNDLRLPYVLLALMFTCIAVLTNDVHAQLPVSSGQTDQQEESTAHHARELVKTLESETARQELIDELKILAEMGGPEEEEGVGTDFAQVIGVEEFAKSWELQYHELLDRHGLDGSLVGKAMGTITLCMLALVMLFIVKRLVRVITGRLQKLVNRFKLSHSRLSLYATGVRVLGYIFILFMTLSAIMTLWNVSVEDWLSSDQQLWFLRTLFSVFVIFVLGALIIEGSNGLVEYVFRRNLRNRTARIETLLPIVRNVLFITLFTLFVLTLLSQVGLNVTPLLAGAGVIGFAVGFGAQTLIKDLLTGFIIIFEDLIQVGDVAGVGGKIGIVERITVRKVQLRDLNGAVYTVPFSEISVVENLTKDFSYYLMDIGVAYRENTDTVVELVKEILEEMRQEEEFEEDILEPMEILGVDKFADSAVLIKARIKTRPIRQWAVGREFNRRMKMAFDERGIEIPFPHRTLYFGEDKNGNAPPMRVNMDACEPSANDDTEGKGKEARRRSPTKTEDSRDGYGDNQD